MKPSPAGFAKQETRPAPSEKITPRTEDPVFPETSSPAASPAEAAAPVPEQTLSGPGPWQDGTYEGEEEGYGGPVRIRLTVANGWIADIEVTEASGEDKPYLRDAKKIIPKVLDRQSTDLDAISGATTSCYAILNAVDLALEEAGP